MKKYLKLVSAVLAVIGVIMMFFTQVSVKWEYPGHAESFAISALVGGSTKYGGEIKNPVSSGLAGYILLGVAALIILVVALVPYFKEHDMLSAVVTTIGNSCLLMANSHVAHDCVLANNIILVNCCGVAGHVRIADHAIMSGLTGIHQFVRVGRFAMLSGLSGLTLDLPPFCYATGTRAKLAGLNLVGLKRAGFKPETIRAIKHAYMELFVSDRTMEESLKLLRSKPQVPEVMELIEFCESTKRGLTTSRAKARKNKEDDDE